MRRATGLQLPVLLSVLLAACARFGAGGSVPGIGPSGVEPADLAGAWQLIRGSGPGGEIHVPAGAQVTIAFEGDRVSGSACNLYGGTFHLGAHGDLTLSAMSMTEMACQEPMMSLEAAYHAALALVRSASLNDEQLTLQGDGAQLVFSRIPPVADADLVGTRWTLTTLFQGDTASSVQGDAWLQLSDDGTLSGSTGCRTVDGSYTVSGDRLAITNLVNTDNACEPAIRGQDRLVLEVLRGGLAFAIDGRQLTLTDAGVLGGKGLGFTAAR